LDSLRKALLQSGAVVDGASARPLHFGSAEVELRAALYRCALVDRSFLGRVTATGPDVLELLHRLSTADLRRLEPGQGRVTVLTSPKGRIVERLFVHHLAPGRVLLLGGPGAAPRVMEHLGRYTFAENTGLEDSGGPERLLALVGPMAGDVLDAIGFERPEPWGSRAVSYEGARVELLGHDGLAPAGFALLTAAENAAALWRGLFLAVTKVDGRPAGEEAMEGLRVLRGVAGPGHELTEDYNPLEAGLREAVSFHKGCYVGQEVVARLENYDKVSRELVGVRMPVGSSVPAQGTPLFHDGREVGTLTSAVLAPGYDRPLGLAYVKRRQVSVGARVALGEGADAVQCELLALPFPVDEG
jgi:hypothetical protein